METNFEHEEAEKAYTRVQHGVSGMKIILSWEKEEKRMTKILRIQQLDKDIREKRILSPLKKRSQKTRQKGEEFNT